MKLDEVEEGMVLVADGGFPCLRDQQKCEVKKDEGGLYIECSEGRHYLDGQGTDLVGLKIA